MHTAPSKVRIKKQHIALFLGILALVSLVFGMVLDTAQRTEANLVSIPFAIAKDERVGGNLKIFLKIDGITGDASESKHKGELDVDSYAWEAARGLGSPKPSLQTFLVTLPAGRASPKLFLNAAGAVKLSRVILSVAPANGDKDFVKWTLTDATIVSFKTVGNIKGDGVSDQIALSFSRIEMEYSPIDGSPTVKAGWDTRTGKSVGY